MRFSRFVVLVLPLFPFDLKLTNQTNQKAPLGDNRILVTSLFRDLLTPSLTDSTHSTGVDSALSLSEMRGRGAGSASYGYMALYGAVMGEDGRASRVLGCWTRVGGARGMVCLTSGWRNWA